MGEADIDLEAEQLAYWNRRPLAENPPWMITNKLECIIELLQDIKAQWKHPIIVVNASGEFDLQGLSDQIRDEVNRRTCCEKGAERE